MIRKCTRGTEVMKITNSTILNDASMPHSKENLNVMKNILENENKQSVQLSKKTIEGAVDALNKFFDVHHRAVQFVIHEELEQYYVQVIDTETKEVIREIPPKKLLDAFYTMQKFLGMIIDEKI
ncbi:flagellar protein FlaG [Anoxybacillus gonensis]|nr:flagellar protein FlaG [Anoxybacillus gonensis]